MEISFNKLEQRDKEYITTLYNSSRSSDKDSPSMKEVQRELAEYFAVTERTIRNWAKKLGLNVMAKSMDSSFKVLIYDLETSRVKANVWWTGKQYISHNQLTEEPKIITVAWKWLGEDKVHHLTWDKNHSDETLVRKFLQVYNSADLVVGQNNDKFDNRWLVARAIKYRLEVNSYVKSFDIMKQAKRIMRVPSYSMAYLTKFLGVTNKQSHEGILMWDMIQYGNKEEQEEFLGKMVDYNVGDIISTEEMYLAMRKYMGHVTHKGVAEGGDKFSCPNCGGTNVELFRDKPLVTAAGTIQRIMICRDDDVQFKISNKVYHDYLRAKSII